MGGLKMRILATRAHGILDYALALATILSPWLLDFGQGGAETVVPLAVGVATVVYSLLTDYELGVARTLSMTTHLRLDVALYALLAASPWVLGFAGHVWGPHLLLGLAGVGASLLTRTQPDFRAARAR
jgi:hypothetical protein